MASAQDNSPRKSIKDLMEGRSKSFGYLRLSYDRFENADAKTELLRNYVDRARLCVEEIDIQGRIVLWKVRENATESKRKKVVHSRQKLEEFLLAIPEGSTFYAYSTLNLAPDARNLNDVLNFLHGRNIRTIFVNELEEDLLHMEDEKIYQITPPAPTPIEPGSQAMFWIGQMARNETGMLGARAQAGVRRAMQDPDKKPGRKRVLSDAQIAKIIELTNAGEKTQKEIALIVKASQPTISRYLLQAELSDLQIRKVKELRAKGMELDAIAFKLNVTRGMVDRFLANEKSKGRALAPVQSPKFDARKRRTDVQFKTADELADELTEIEKRVDARIKRSKGPAASDASEEN